MAGHPGRICRLAGIGLGIAGLLGVPSIASAEPPHGSGGAIIISDSRELSSRAIIKGTVKGKDGQAVSGARVELTASPPAETLARIKVGESYRPLTLARTSADSQGNYVLRIAPEADLRKVLSKYGTIDVSVVSWTDSALSVNYLSITSRQAPNGTARAILDLGTRSATRTAVVNPVLVPQPEKARTAGGIRLPDECMRKESLGNHRVEVGRIYDHAQFVTVNFTYAANNFTTLGLGWSADGTHGSYEQRGTMYRIVTATVGFEEVIEQKAFNTQVAYSKWECVTATPPSRIWAEARPDALIGGATYTVPDGFPAFDPDNCVLHHSNTKWELAGTKAETAEHGVTITEAIGINLSSQSGYEKTSKMGFKFEDDSSLCGTKGAPGVADPGFLVLPDNQCIMTGTKGRKTDLAC